MEIVCRLALLFVFDSDRRQAPDTGRGCRRRDPPCRHSRRSRHGRGEPAAAARDKRESPLATFRSGWAGRKNPDADQRAAAAAAAVGPVDLSLAQFLRETVDRGQAYLQVDDLAATLQRAKEKATGVLPGHRDR